MGGQVGLQFGGTLEGNFASRAWPYTYIENVKKRAIMNTLLCIETLIQTWSVVSCCGNNCDLLVWILRNRHVLLNRMRLDGISWESNGGHERTSQLWWRLMNNLILLILSSLFSLFTATANNGDNRIMLSFNRNAASGCVCNGRDQLYLLLLRLLLVNGDTWHRLNEVGDMLSWYFNA